ncbi:transketolase [candidate division KSB1 bacterium]|nr:transketolase [candidate division KSB1 bacterium]NIR70850.1 transketolase [candidate division KSB1 bacterium]NIS24636.1 transketolase [candidate division KSB1 bacterium]NIT71538.1 transketolase [candidate division KSB1 bacterium]NIU25236.1 transketolase [candidate division KSB1 bacterium]
MSIDDLCINTIRTLAMDAVQKANSGHPGTPMALAPLAYVLWTKFLKYNPKNPNWFDRDRFVLSNGHASMLQYAMLFLTGYEVSLDDIKNFRQWGSITPGHPEVHLTPGVETTTGPLGQGVMNSVGMAIAEAHLAAKFNRDGYDIVNHYTYAFCSDGDLMEGASHEAASLAGHFGLSKLIWVYDDNHISIEGATDITYSDNVARRFEGYNWHVQDLGDKGNDLDAITKGFTEAREEKEKPSLIILRTHIAYGAPNMQDTPEAHGAPLGEDEVKETKKRYGWPEDETFLVPPRAMEHMRKAIAHGRALEDEWQMKYDNYKSTFPELADQFERAMRLEPPKDWDANIPEFDPSEGSVATRKASSTVINSFSQQLPWIIGGSGDLAPSTKTLMEDSKYFLKGQHENRNIAWGVREHAMCAASSGMALHGGVRPYASTFFIFTDYARPAIRLAALMELPVIYVMTHDSIGLGEDGPTHQPVEHLAAMRAMPNMCVIRPADANEVGYAWRAAMLRKVGPTMLVLTRQGVPIFDRSQVTSAAGVMKGAYVLSKEDGYVPDVVLLASGSEVQLILEAQKQLRAEGIDARVVSMPSWELFQEQPQEYRQEVLPPKVKVRLAVEAGAPQGWRQWVGDAGDVIGVTKYGASAPYKENFLNYGFTTDKVVNKAKHLIDRFKSANL